MRLEIWPQSDLPSVRIMAHVECFAEASEPSIMPDPPDKRGRIPPSALCVFCGEKLPIIGRHPFALELHQGEVTSRYWAHAGCIEDRLDLNPA